MNKKLIIDIPDDLSEQEEAILIAKKIGRKMLQIANSGTGRNKAQKRIGAVQVDSAKMPTFDIQVNRIAPKTRIMPMIECYCGTMFDKKNGYKYYHNYGGMPKQKICCSSECRDAVLENFPGRSSLKKISPSFLIRTASMTEA